MRVVVDTNVFVTALLHGATPRRVYESFLRGDFSLVYSADLLVLHPFCGIRIVRPAEFLRLLP